VELAIGHFLCHLQHELPILFVRLAQQPAKFTQIPRILAPRTSSACSSETNTSASDSLSFTTRTIGDIIPNLSELEVEMHGKHRTERRV